MESSPQRLDRFLTSFHSLIFCSHILQATHIFVAHFKERIMAFGKQALQCLVLLAGPASLGNAQETLNDYNVGPRDRFWRHHIETKTLFYEGHDYYPAMEECLSQNLSDEDREAIATQTGEGIRHAGRLFSEDFDEDQVFLVQVKKAMLPIHVKAVQTLASCTRTVFPHLYESRPMYQEWNLDEDPGLGGNCPTHLVPLVGIFLPEVIEQMQQTLEVAYEAAGWEELVRRDRYQLYYEQTTRAAAIHPPQAVGVRASEHLTYRDFPTLSDHTDGEGTVYTLNFAFSDEYEGGEFYIWSNEDDDGERQKHVVKPQKYDAVVFLGGKYLHGVQQIRGGMREMFSTEFWPYPDSPFGTSLWTNEPSNMEKYIQSCNEEMEENETDYDIPCGRPFPTTTPFGIEIDEVRKKYDGNSKPTPSSEEKLKQRVQALKKPNSRPNRVRPDTLTPTRFRDAKGHEYDLDDFRPREDEPDFLIPRKLEPGQLEPIRWRETLQPVDGDEGESFVIGFPPELHQEFAAYVEKTGMKNVARKLLYEEEPLVPHEHRIYTLDDGSKWGAMIQGHWNTDMVWLDPADEECFEDLLSILRRGNFSQVLDKVGNAFDLEGLMVQGVGAIFLSEYEYSENMHVDIQGSKGSFYNVIVPVHIPENEKATFYVADAGDEENKGVTCLDPNVGIVLGGESSHGTGECNYRETQDFRLSFAIYVADINDDNVELIASDSTSLWPTQGDTEWFLAQRARLWSKDGHSVEKDPGRKPMTVEDIDNDCSAHDCESDPQGKRLQCPKTCRLYLNDEDYRKVFDLSGEAPKLK